MQRLKAKGAWCTAKHIMRKPGVGLGVGAEGWSRATWPSCEVCLGCGWLRAFGSGHGEVTQGKKVGTWRLPHKGMGKTSPEVLPLVWVEGRLPMPR